MDLKNIECPREGHVCPLVKEIRRLEKECRKLQEISNLDTLTGYFNYRYLLTALEAEMERSRRSGLPTGLIMIDLDHFKKVNDQYGHENGNRVLRWSSELWRKNLRRIDVPCRYGGEEFVIILPGSRLSETVRAAERLRIVLASSPVKFKHISLNLTASFGVDSYTSNQNISVDAFIKRADRFLLQAKAKGRNCVCYDQQETITFETEVTTEERETLIGPMALTGKGRKT